MIKSKKKKIQMFSAFALLIFACLWWGFGLVWALVVGVLGFLFLFLNLYAKKKIAWNADHLFTDIGRNYDYLLIGEPWNHENLKGTKICFFSPNRSWLSSYEMSRRLFSLLKEETGTLVISCRNEALNSKRISVLDIPYLHEIQLHKYGITHSKLKTYLPFVFAPIDTMRYFLASTQEKKSDVSLADYSVMVDFCKARNINLEIIKTK